MKVNNLKSKKTGGPANSQQKQAPFFFEALLQFNDNADPCSLANSSFGKKNVSIRDQKIKSLEPSPLKFKTPLPTVIPFANLKVNKNIKETEFKYNNPESWQLVASLQYFQEFEEEKEVGAPGALLQEDQLRCMIKDAFINGTINQATFASAGSNILKIKRKSDDEEYQVESCLSIAFCQYQSLAVTIGQTINHCIVLTWRTNPDKLKTVRYLILAATSDEEIKHWERTLGRYTIRSWKRFEEDYEYREKLGQGAFGKVMLAVLRQGDDECEESKQESDTVAVKIIDKEKIMGFKFGSQSLCNEIRVHWALDECDGVLKLLRIYEDSKSMMLVLEYQPKGSLMKSLKNQTRFTEAEVRVMMSQILLTLDFFQQKKIVHRDIKPDNILIKSI